MSSHDSGKETTLFNCKSFIMVDTLKGKTSYNKEPDDWNVLCSESHRIKDLKG